MKKRAIRITIITIVAVILLVSLSTTLDFKPIDFSHYIISTKLLLNGESPYEVEEFFFPPWSVFILGPFTLLPFKFAVGIWLILMIGAQFLSGSLALNWLNRTDRDLLQAAALILPAFLPGALFSFVTGQISPLIGLAILIAFWICTKNSSYPLLLSLALVLASIKPHITAFPMLLCVLELVRRKGWDHLAWIAILFTVLVGLGYIILPNWVFSLFEALRGESYKGGPGLVAPGHQGLVELGVPYWLLVPPLIYTIYAWVKDHLSSMVVSLALATGLLLAPYSRSYDQVLLTFPAMIALIKSVDGSRFAATLVLGSAAILPLTTAWMLAPVVCLIGLLFFRHDQTNREIP